MKTARCLLLAACLIAPSAHAAKTLVYCSEGSPDTFNPQLSNSGTTFDATAIQIFDRLLSKEPGGTRLVPSLAEKWDISADGLQYTFSLRRGVKFHSNARFKPSRDFNADDVVFTFRRMGDPNHPFHKTIPGRNFAYYYDKELDKIIDKVEKVDDYTVRFKLKRTDAPFLINFAMSFTSIHSLEYAEKMKAAGTPEVIDFEPIGNGPFQFVSYQKDATIRYKAFEQYWAGRPKIDNLLFAITPDASVRYAKLKAGECHVMAYPKPADLAAIKADPALRLLSQEALNVGYIAFNVNKKPLDNKLVRQALNLATDKAAILRNIYQGSARAGKNPLPPSLWSHHDALPDYNYDPARAKALLEKAGYPNGLSFDLWYLPVSRPYNPDGKRMAELLQADWAKVGVKVNLLTYEWGEYLKRSKHGEHQVVMLGWSANADPDEFLGPNLSCDAVKGGGNVARWCHAAFDSVYQKARSTLKQADRSKLYEQAQEIVREEAPWIVMAHALLLTPVRKEVKGLIVSPDANHFFHQADLEK
ncbi:ABC transporter substrate-binding protein [Massilia sp. W12]|uniref:ABC transporter substrate-binding protein n=1 Tax=Massilia sp. W12 TaxID=3126507 RepID=UPI0030D0B5AD